MEGFDFMLNEKLVQGAFLTTECDGKANSMTIGWGMEGRCWNRPVFIAMVRPSRYTFELMQKAKTFTVSIPREGEMKDALVHFGKVSGRSENKFRSCSMILSDAKEITGKIIEGCEYHYECKVLFSQQMDPSCFVGTDSLQHAFYPQGDYHYIIFGEIVAKYDSKC